jgi:hypothetical protein
LYESFFITNTTIIKCKWSIVLSIICYFQLLCVVGKELLFVDQYMCVAYLNCFYLHLLPYQYHDIGSFFIIYIHFVCFIFFLSYFIHFIFDLCINIIVSTFFINDFLNINIYFILFMNYSSFNVPFIFISSSSLLF